MLITEYKQSSSAWWMNNQSYAACWVNNDLADGTVESKYCFSFPPSWNQNLLSCQLAQSKEQRILPAMKGLMIGLVTRHSFEYLIRSFHNFFHTHVKEGKREGRKNSLKKYTSSIWKK